jgi:hypothetical protein
MSISLLCKVSFANRFEAMETIDLMLACYKAVSAKNVTAVSLTAETLQARKTSEELLQMHKAQLQSIDSPMATVSVRNVLANHRCIAFHENYRQPVAVKGEVFNSIRPYHALGLTKNNRLEITEIFITPETLKNYRWFITGVPVLWDEDTPSSLLDRLLAEVSDISHVYFLPRGQHPAATPYTEKIWHEIHDIFLGNLSASRKQAAEAVRHLASHYQLERESRYFHHLLSVDEEGRLCELADTGSLEALGLKIHSLFGVKRAICVDNGGSVAMHYYAKGIQGEGVRLSHLNYRTRGTAFLCMQLKSPCFKLG